MTKWEELLRFIRKQNLGEVVTRQQLLNEIQDFSGNRIGQTLDIYRRYLTKAGYLMSIGIGKYEVTRKPSLNLTTYDCKIGSIWCTM